MRGQLSRLASAGKIKRIRPGLYEAAPTSLLSPLAEQVESQTAGAIQFDGDKNKPIHVRRRASAGELRTDSNVVKRHAEVVRRTDQLLTNYSRSTQGGNASSGLVGEIAAFRETLGDTIETLDPDLLIPRGDGLRSDLAAYRSKDDFSKLPPVPDDLLAALEKAVGAYNNYVALDPELARRDEALLGPDARKKLVVPEEGQQVVHDAVVRRAATPDVEDILGEEAKVAPSIPDPESRQSRRYSEGAKNFARKALEQASDYAAAAWRHKGRVATGVTSSYLAAQWVVANEAWLLSTFANHPSMLSVTKSLIDFLKTLPLA